MNRVFTTLSVAALMLGGCSGGPGTLSASPTSPAGAATPGSSLASTPAADSTTPGGGTPGGAPTPTGASTFVINPTATSPSDDLPANTIVGTVLAASAGPCYLVETDEGSRYALYGSAGAVSRGQRVKALTAPMTASVDCGPGIQLKLVKLET